MTVLVVGGGITGLTTAYALGRAGVPTLLVEAAERLGGKVGTIRRDGFLVETGPDSFISYRPAAIELARELGLGDALIRPTEPRTVRIRARGRFARLPDGMGLVLPTRMWPFITSDLFSPVEKLRMGLDLVLPRDGLEHDVAVGTFLRRRLGSALVERLAGPLIGGVYGTPVDELSLLAVVPQLRDAERDHRSLMLASLAGGRARKGQPSRSPFVTLAGGTGQLTEALVGAIGYLPTVEVRTGAAVAALEPAAGGFVVRLGDGEPLRPEAVVLTTPGPVAAGLLDAFAPGAAGSIRTIRHGGTAVVSVGYRLDEFPTPPVGHGFLVAAGEPLTIDACTFSSQKWAGRAPDGSILMRCFVGSHDPAAVALTDEELVARVRRDLERTLGVRAAPALVQVARFADQMPHYTIGHLDRVARTFDALAATPELILAGAPYRGVGMPDCITQARAAAARVTTLLGGSTAETDSRHRASTTEPGAAAGVATTTPPQPTAERPHAAAVAARVTNVTGAVPARAPATIRLDRMAVGRAGRIASVGMRHGSELALEGVRPGADLTVAAAAPFDGPVVLRVGRARVAVARSVARTVEVSAAGEAPKVH